MININFFEKKEKNILPYLVGGGFLFLLTLMSIYFFFARLYLQDVVADKGEWITEHEEQVSLSKRISRLEQQYDETIELQGKLKLSQYPMNKIATEIAASVPDELTRISSFQLVESNQIILTLENTEAIMAQEIVENIENLPYITGIQLLFAENQNEESRQLHFELIVDIDEELILEEEAE